MFTIGDFARSGRVSVRMLRHYDAIGLLRPASVDPFTGYRSYRAEQLARLNRVVALKDLGFTLDQVATIVDDEIDVDELRGMLRLRRAELREQIAADAARLARVEARLRIIEREGAMSAKKSRSRPFRPSGWPSSSAPVGGFEPQFITPVLGPLFDQLMRRLGEAGVPCVGRADRLLRGRRRRRGSDRPRRGADPRRRGPRRSGRHRAAGGGAASIIHRGPMDDVMPTIQTLGRLDRGARLPVRRLQP